MMSFPFKGPAASLLAMAVLQAGNAGRVEAAPQRFRVARSVAVPPGTTGQACAVLDAAVFERTHGNLDAMRLYRMQGGVAISEVAFATTESGEAGQREEVAAVTNLGVGPSGAIVFDLEMPSRAYTEVRLTLAARDFFAQATVWGGRAGDAEHGTKLGAYALFDLTGQRLSRSTSLPLQEVTFPVLHVALQMRPAVPGADGAFAPSIVQAASVPPSRMAQTLFTKVSQSGNFTVKDRQTVATIAAPAYVPAERLVFTLAPDFAANFSRDVRVFVPSTGQGTQDVEVGSGNIERLRVSNPEGGGAVRSEQLAVESLFGANQHEATTLVASVANGDDVALPLRLVTLQMRERKLCFDAERDAGYVLLEDVAEGELRAPLYDYRRLFASSPAAAVATLGGETPNAQFRQETQRVPYTQRHPEVLWVALLVAVGVLGGVALRSAKRVGS